MQCGDQECALASYLCQQYIARRVAPMLRVGALVLNVDPKHHGCRVGRLCQFDLISPEKASPFDSWEIESMPFGVVVSWENRAVVAFDPLNDEGRHMRCTKEAVLAT